MHHFLAPGPALNPAILEKTEGGFSVRWCNPQENPQCAFSWKRTVSDTEGVRPTGIRKKHFFY